MELFAVIYTYEGEHSFEGITNSPDLWLKKHNYDRINAGEMPESEDEFEFHHWDYEPIKPEDVPDYETVECELCGNDELEEHIKLVDGEKRCRDCYDD